MFLFCGCAGSAATTLASFLSFPCTGEIVARPASRATAKARLAIPRCTELLRSTDISLDASLLTQIFVAASAERHVVNVVLHQQTRLRRRMRLVAAQTVDLNANF